MGLALLSKVLEIVKTPKMDLAVGDEDVQEESINLSEGVGRDWGTLGDL